MLTRVTPSVGAAWALAGTASAMTASVSAAAVRTLMQSSPDGLDRRRNAGIGCLFEVVRRGASVRERDVRRTGLVLLSALAALLGVASKASAAPYTADKAVKINVMGEW